VATAAEDRLSFSMLGLLGWRGSVEAREGCHTAPVLPFTGRAGALLRGTFGQV